MKIYLDSKDIIDLFEKSKPCKADEFDKILRENEHGVILSETSIFEIAGSLMSSNHNTMSLLNSIDSIPRKFIAGSEIDRLELIEALKSFTNGREYCQISPFVNRFDETLPNSPTHRLINYSTAATVFDLWMNGFDFLQRYKQISRLFRAVVDADRARPGQSILKKFIETIRKQLLLNNLSIPSRDLEPFVKWIYKFPTRCPSIRLTFEVYYQLVKNKEDKWKEEKGGDISDFNHLSVTPYVDLITLDNNKREYVKQASHRVKMGYESRLCKNVESILSILSKDF